MRDAFISTLQKMAEKDERVFLVTADVGYSVLEGFVEKFPGRYLNTGVAEADMIGIAAGLAMSGRIVYAYTMSHFLTMRCFEQIRLDMCYQNTDVKLIGSGGGLTYGSAGATHHSIEDISIMRSLPNMCVICPGDPVETRHAMEASLKHHGPVYIRLGKSDPRIHKEEDIDFRIGQGITLKEGTDLNIVSTGNMLETAEKASDLLAEEHISAGVISMHTVKPLDVKLIKKLAYSGKPMFTLEEHSIIGGLGSAVSEVLAEMSSGITFKRIGLPDEYSHTVGSQHHLRKKFGIDHESVVRTIKETIKENE